MKKAKIKGHKIAILVGTRPEAIKLAPVAAKLKQVNFCETLLISSGQHVELLQDALASFGLDLDIQLKLDRAESSLSSLGGGLLFQISKCLEELRPDLIIVHGDTSTAFFGSLAAFYGSIPIAHVEAGLRTQNIREPFPEEFNRRTIASYSNLHFAPTANAKNNLRLEGVLERDIFVTGNTIVDAVLMAYEGYLTQEAWLEASRANIKRNIFPLFGSQGFALITLHRRENAGAPFSGYLKTIRRLAGEWPSFHFVFPVHPNPSITAQAVQELANLDNVWLCPPSDHLTFLHLLIQSEFIVSDSGGVQEEAVTLGKHVYLCRNATERPEGVEHGDVTLVGQNFELLHQLLAARIERDLATSSPPRTFFINLDNNPFGSGNASQLIVDELEKYLSK